MRFVPFAAAAAAAVVVSLSVALAQEGKAPEPPKGVASLAWLAGDWSSEDEGGAFDEHWLPPRGDAMFAVSRLVQGGKTGMCELSVIEDTADGTWLRIRHYSRSLEPWKMDAEGPLAMKLAAQTETSATFEDPKREFPRRIVYRREADVLVARLEGERGGKPMEEEFRLKLTSAR